MLAHCIVYLEKSDDTSLTRTQSSGTLLNHGILNGRPTQVTPVAPNNIVPIDSFVSAVAVFESLVHLVFRANMVALRSSVKVALVEDSVRVVERSEDGIPGSLLLLVALLAL